MEHKIFDGNAVKSVDHVNYGAGDSLADIFGTEDTGITRPRAWSTVGWCFRCVEIRANALVDIPWTVNRGDTEVATSDDIAGEDHLATFSKMLYLTESALTIVGEAFWYILRNRRRRVVDLQWFAPNTIEPVWTGDGISHYKRTVNSTIIRVPVDDVIYFRAPNPLHESKPGPSPMGAALADAGVVADLNSFASKFFERGAIRATMLTVDGTPTPQERARLRSWWQRVFGGRSNAFGAEVFSTSVTPVTVGDGVGDLDNAELSSEKRTAISSALGVPNSLLLSDAANYATARADRLNLYDFTINPESRHIAAVLNKYLFGPQGQTLIFDPSSLPVYRINETERSETLQTYVTAGVPLPIAAEIVNLPLPVGVEYSDLMAPEPPAPEPPAESTPEAEDPEPARTSPTVHVDSANRDREIRQFKKWYAKRNNPNVDRFESEYLTPEDKRAIAATLTDQPDPAPPAIQSPAVKRAVGSDPNNREDEQRRRMSVEDQTAASMEQALAGWLQDVFPRASMPELEEIERRLIDGSWRIRDVLDLALRNSSDLGVRVAVDQLNNAGLAFDYQLAHENAIEWVQSYVNNLVSDITAVTWERVQRAIVDWSETGDDLPALIRQMTPIFGRQRAELIASTEVTRAYAEGAKAGYIAAGVIETVQWQTSVDDMVCPTCRPMNETQTEIAAEFTNPETGEKLFPPAHPRCRCWIVPVVETS